MAQEMMMQEMPGAGTPMAEAGRGTDMIMAHLTPGEIVIPVELQQDPDVMGMLQALFQQSGADLAQYTVGDQANNINPETGYPEFGFFKSLRRIASFALPAAAAFIPGIGIPAAAALGAAGGLAGGGGLKSALLGGLTSGAGNYLNNGGFSSLFGSLPGTNNLPWLPAGLQGGAVESGSGLLGSLGRTTGLTSNSVPSLGGIIGGNSGGGSSFGGLGSSLATAFGGYNQNEALKKQQQQLLGANQQQLANLDTFDPSGITEDPGYEFNRAEGERGLQRSLGAQGNVFSGRALKAASQYNQDYANNAFKDYYQRWLTKTGAQNQLYGTGGDVRANATGARAQNLSQTLAGIFAPNDIRRQLGLVGY